MRCVPKTLRVVYTVLAIALVPVFVVEYGPLNFLWFSNIALLATLVAMWIGSRLLLSMMAVGVVVLEIGWNLAFWGELLAGLDFLGLVAYMFDDRIPLWTRLMSLYHVPLPVVLLVLVWRCGYDPRAFRWQTGLAWIVLPVSLVLSTPVQNINHVYGIVDQAGQPILPSPLPLVILMVGLPLVIYWPTHAVLKRYFPRADLGKPGESTSLSSGSSATR